MDKHCVSLEISRDLKEAGWKKEAEFWWWRPNKTTNHWEINMFKKVSFIDDNTCICAPLATEILEELPDMSFDTGRRNNLWVVFFQNNTEGEKVNVVCKDKSLPNALAKMWLFLKKEKLI